MYVLIKLVYFKSKEFYVDLREKMKLLMKIFNLFGVVLSVGNYYPVENLSEPPVKVPFFERFLSRLFTEESLKPIDFYIGR